MLVRALGSTIPFTPEAITRRYGNRVGFLERVRQAGEVLARDGYLLEDDVEAIVSTSSKRWERAVCSD
jgi:hypothetical protein